MCFSKSLYHCLMLVKPRKRGEDQHITNILFILLFGIVFKRISNLFCLCNVKGFHKLSVHAYIIWASTPENQSLGVNKGADQTAHLRSLISAFVIHLLERIISGLVLSGILIFYLVFVAE